MPLVSSLVALCTRGRSTVLMTLRFRQNVGRKGCDVHVFFEMLHERFAIEEVEPGGHVRNLVETTQLASTTTSEVKLFKMQLLGVPPPGGSKWADMTPMQLDAALEGVQAAAVAAAHERFAVPAAAPAGAAVVAAAAAAAAAAVDASGGAGGAADVALAYAQAFSSSNRDALVALFSPAVALRTPRGETAGAALAERALMVARARMAEQLVVGGPEPLPLDTEVGAGVSFEVTFTFASKHGAVVVMADVVTVQGSAIVRIARSKKTAGV